jgi:hypothetical protein
MKIFGLIIFFFFIQRIGFSQFYKDDKGEKIAYNSLPSNDDFMEHYILGDRVYKFYYDTVHHFQIQIPDSFQVQKTGSKDMVIFRLPIIQETYDFISVTSFSKERFISIDSLVYKNLTKHRSGDYLNGNKQGVFQSAVLIDTLTYKVELNCNGDFCTQQWCFRQNNFGYYVIMLASKKETYNLRLNIFKKFILQDIKLF